MGRKKVKTGRRLGKRLARARWDKERAKAAAAAAAGASGGTEKKAGSRRRQMRRPTPGAHALPLPPGLEDVGNSDPRYKILRRAAKAYVSLTQFPRGCTHIYLVHDEEAEAGQAERLKKLQRNEDGQEFYDQATVDELHLVQLPAIVFLEFEGGKTELVLAVAAAPCGAKVVAALTLGNQAMMTIFGSKPGVREMRVLAGKMVMGGYRKVMGNDYTCRAGYKFGPYSWKKSNMLAENSFVAALAAAEACHLMQPLFGSFLKVLRRLLDSAGSPPTLEQTPFTTKAASGQGFGSALHYDAADFGDYSCLAFYAAGPNPDALKGGTVYFPHLGLAVQPRGCTAVLLKTTAVYHGTTPSWTKGGEAEYFATALVANKNAVKFGVEALEMNGGKLPVDMQLGQCWLTEEAMKDERVKGVLQLLQK